MTLNEHRQAIKATEGKIDRDEQTRLYSTIKPHLIKAGGRNLKAKNTNLFVDLLLETQSGQPFFWINSELPFCWNNPRDWNKYPYIRFQWGHLIPTNSLMDCNQLENLCLQSARCNNQIQSSMPLGDLKELFFGSRTYDRIIEVEEKRRVLFETSEWRVCAKNYWRENVQPSIATHCACRTSLPPPKPTQMFHPASAGECRCPSPVVNDED